MFNKLPPQYKTELDRAIANANTDGIFYIDNDPATRRIFEDIGKRWGIIKYYGDKDLDIRIYKLLGGAYTYKDEEDEYERQLSAISSGKKRTLTHDIIVAIAGTAFGSLCTWLLSMC